MPRGHGSSPLFILVTALPVRTHGAAKNGNSDSSTYKRLVLALHGQQQRYQTLRALVGIGNLVQKRAASTGQTPSPPVPIYALAQVESKDQQLITTPSLTMDYSRPNHVPTAAETAAAERNEYRYLMMFAALMTVVVVAAAIVLGSQITR